jgi:hypothetical protein
MKANPIGDGTVNVSVNMLLEERSVLGRLALAEDRSLGDHIRRMVTIGLRVTNPAAAIEFEAARSRHNSQPLLAAR